MNYILYDEINPQLASHGGNVHLDCITKDNYVVLQFGGGCQGCGMVDVTLKEGIEKTLLEKIPELKGVKDIPIILRTKTHTINNQSSVFG